MQLGRAHNPFSLCGDRPPALAGGRLARQLLGLCALMPALLGSDAANAQSVSYAAPVYPNAHPAVARVRVASPTEIDHGSGTLVRATAHHGLLITNYHVIQNALPGGSANELEVTFPSGMRSPGTILAANKLWDLAAIAVWRPRVEPVKIAETAPRPGDPLTIAGYGPNGVYRTATGRCLQYLRPEDDASVPAELIELSGEAREGDSGGPIFNARGELSGVLFGSGDNFTVGSYCGRVQRFVDAAEVPFLALLPPKGATTIAVSPPSETASETPGATNSVALTNSSEPAEPRESTRTPEIPPSGTRYSSMGWGSPDDSDNLDAELPSEELEEDEESYYSRFAAGASDLLEPRLAGARADSHVEEYGREDDSPYAPHAGSTPSDRYRTQPRTGFAMEEAEEERNDLSTRYGASPTTGGLLSDPTEGAEPTFMPNNSERGVVGVILHPEPEADKEDEVDEEEPAETKSTSTKPNSKASETRGVSFWPFAWPMPTASDSNDEKEEVDREKKPEPERTPTVRPIPATRTSAEKPARDSEDKEEEISAEEAAPEHPTGPISIRVSNAKLLLAIASLFCVLVCFNAVFRS